MKKLLLALVISSLTAVIAHAQALLLDDFNSGTASGAPLTGTTWFTAGNVVQNATTITVGGSALDDNGWGRLGAIDATGYNFISFAAQIDNGNAAATFVVDFRDSNLMTQQFSITIPTIATAMTTYYIPIASWGDVDPSVITRWTIGGGTTGVAAFHVTFDNLALTTTNAVPEPSTYAMIAGVLALGFVAWRRRSVSA